MAVKRVKIVFYTSERDVLRRDRQGCCQSFMRCLQYVCSKEPGDSPYYEHVEVILPNNYVTSSTESGGGVHYTVHKTLRNDGYCSVLSLPVTLTQEWAMVEQARQMAEKGTGFNDAGFKINFIPVLGWLMPMKRQGKLVFCSEYATMLLQTAGYLEGVEPHRVSPSKLYQLIKQCDAAMHDYNHKAPPPPPVTKKMKRSKVLNV